MMIDITEEMERTTRLVEDLLAQENIGAGRSTVVLLGIVYAFAVKSPDLVFRLSILQALSGTMQGILQEVISGTPPSIH